MIDSVWTLLLKVVEPLRQVSAVHLFSDVFANQIYQLVSVLARCWNSNLKDDEKKFRSNRDENIACQEKKKK